MRHFANLIPNAAAAAPYCSRFHAIHTSMKRFDGCRTAMEGNKSRRHYKCQRCLNHGYLSQSKKHQYCPYRKCLCNKCMLNVARKLANKQIRQTMERAKNRQHSEAIDDQEEPFIDVLSDDTELANYNLTLERTTNRNPKCKKCRHHGVTADLKGHRKRCDFRNCSCDGCRSIDFLRDTMKEQVKLRRRLHLAAAAAAEKADVDLVADEQPRPTVIVKKFEINLPGSSNGFQPPHTVATGFRRVINGIGGDDCSGSQSNGSYDSPRQQFARRNGSEKNNVAVTSSSATVAADLSEFFIV